MSKTPFNQFIEEFIPNERKRLWFMWYCAMCVQQPEIKQPSIPLLHGPQGNGKTTMLRILANAVGDGAVVVSYGEFNRRIEGVNAEFLRGRTLICVDGLTFRKPKLRRLMDFYCSETLVVEERGCTPMYVGNHINVIATSNSDTVPERMRCFTVIPTGTPSADTIKQLRSWLGTDVMEDLFRTWPISSEVSI